MGLFGRKKGRHALGAAVTSIPSRPPVLPVLPVLPVSAAPAPVADPVVQPVAPATTTTAGAVAELLATGEWAGTVESVTSVLAAAPAAAPPADPPGAVTVLLDRPPVSTPEPEPVPPLAVPVVAPAPAPVSAPAPVPAPAAAAAPASAPAPARSSLEAALAGLVTAQPREAAVSRVQLGFRDGTSAQLDPQSSQYLALEELAQSLTRRD